MWNLTHTYVLMWPLSTHVLKCCKQCTLCVNSSILYHHALQWGIIFAHNRRGLVGLTIQLCPSTNSVTSMLTFQWNKLKTIHVSSSISSTLISTHDNKPPLNSCYACWSLVVLARWTLTHDMEWNFILRAFHCDWCALWDMGPKPPLLLYTWWLHLVCMDACRKETRK